MKVYVMVMSWTDDDGYCGQNAIVYDSLEKAQKELQKQIKEYKKEKYYDSFDIDNLSMSAYKKGEYLISHTDIEILEEEVL